MNPKDRLIVALDTAWMQAYYLDDATAAKATVRRALGRIPMERIDPADRPWVMLLTIAAVTQDGPAAQAAFSAFERDRTNSPARMIRGSTEVAKALVALAERRPKDAAALLSEADKGDLGAQQIGPWRAHAFIQANQPDSAIVEFERYLGFADPTLTTVRDHRATSHRRLGELYEAKGSTEKAAEHYRAFVAQWSKADSELQPQVTAARERLKKLTPVERPRE